MFGGAEWLFFAQKPDVARDGQGRLRGKFFFGAFRVAFANFSMGHGPLPCGPTTPYRLSPTLGQLKKDARKKDSSRKRRALRPVRHLARFALNARAVRRPMVQNRKQEG